MRECLIGDLNFEAQIAKHKVPIARLQSKIPKPDWDYLFKKKLNFLHGDRVDGLEDVTMTEVALTRCIL